MKTYKGQQVSDDLADFLEKRDALYNGIEAMCDAFFIKSVEDWMPTKDDDVTPAEMARERADLSRGVKSALEHLEWASTYLGKHAREIGLIAGNGEFYFQVWEDAQAHRINMAEQLMEGLRTTAPTNEEVTV